MSAFTVASEVLAHIKAGLPHVDIFDESVPDDNEMPVIEGTATIKPHATISFGGLVKGPKSNDGIAGAKLNGREMDVVVRAVANNPSDCRNLLNRIDALLVGFMPTNCGEVDSALYGSTGQVSGLGKPSRFAGVNVYTVTVNSDVFEL
ncbi:hypothetical protein SEA_THUNDERCLAP_30 [Arthrobacter phage Thunderclap]|uniref:Tail terminator n=10 Tax=Amigovirus amigo TaxID=1982100 RepID=A0A0U4INC0_9CAUD|nr:hypothetical protein FDH66_gp73 [Arthrobacter phage Amigo]ALY08475.1 hypothetical protein ANANSI_30 [Arthrobacter phage Anansi]ALY09089.1 hypothetical protein GORGEOUS_30 [Arthrobacter phage Gorgeous]ALY10106.1 hypothetical protein RINGS_29 [Arthrobacter phage Rings]ALY10370.1 hypothetical protein SORJUANA_30 [Arthrobacter phage SorJuana]QFG08324.1 hypothetical protein SEA_YEEZUS_29 [Arthrobacter phage Yeezus]QFG13372.1 hypothetical protein SEA_ICHOR_29 [Arthrobacter phage Ichor]QFG13890.